MKKLLKPTVFFAYFESGKGSRHYRMERFVDSEPDAGEFFDWCEKYKIEIEDAKDIGGEQCIIVNCGIIR